MSYVSLRAAEVVWTLASVSEVRKFAKGEVIVKEGDCAAQECLGLAVMAQWQSQWMAEIQKGGELWIGYEEHHFPCRYCIG